MRLKVSLLVCVFSAGQERLFLELRGKAYDDEHQSALLTMCAVEIQVHATMLARSLAGFFSSQNERTRAEKFHDFQEIIL